MIALTFMMRGRNSNSGGDVQYITYTTEEGVIERTYTCVVSRDTQGPTMNDHKHKTLDADCHTLLHCLDPCHSMPHL